MGEQFLDNRGLVCADDFSLPIIRDAMVDYELRNKNYQNVFNRQIQNMETMNSIARQEAGWQIASGTISGAAGGAMAGAMTGNPYAAIGGAVIGGATALAGGIADANNLKKKQQETIDFTRDLFGFQLGNIKALPNSLSRTAAFVYNTSYIPTLEYYTCTDLEKQALRDKIAYNGMNVGVIGKISDYQLNVPSYIKGKIIRFPSEMDIDFHEANIIAEEINKGVII